MPVTLTERAARHVEKMLASEDAAQGLRLGIKASGCSGFAYVVDYAQEIGEQDLVVENHGVKVVVAQQHRPFLEGTEVDYVRDGINYRFDFRNPNVRDLCGCGESFAV
ncbi:HesB/IscA family protein [Halorhodospira halophila]|uniref:Iron-sulfur cluster assembly accessory protein n=1 Tax=Halorhodospira halophila (strain DSM 244 / SL1) TaxID=349124 RepID=A1WXZ5_HALHL|nr:iron-sulfur cluster assembly accessory protein [Halorhodospira halophila]ABM62557.1 iron-sulfur cluster assembly accessory protein [Halorhodospira halophila SL1]MBK1728236.1 iron-sulfur cluster assembly accessory protein [Halorhodospira halophila]